MSLNRVLNHVLFVVVLAKLVVPSYALAEEIDNFYSPPIIGSSEKVLDIVEKYKIEVVSIKTSLDSGAKDLSEIELEHDSASATYIYYLNSFLLNGDNSKVKGLRASDRLRKKASDADLSEEQLIRQKKNFNSLIADSTIEITHEYRVNDLGLVFLRQLIHSKDNGSSNPFTFFIPKLMLIDGKYYIDDIARHDVERELVKVLREEFPFNERTFEKKKL